MNYLVTGGAGFIGSHIVDRLLADGHRVRVLDDFSTGREANMSGFASRVELFRGTVADPIVVAKAMEGVDGVFHQAAIPSVPRSVANPLQTHRSIVDGTLMILEEMRRLGAEKAPKMVMASSSSIYGESPALPKQEDMRPEPLSPYAVAKLDAENYTLLYARQYALRTVALRYFNVFGPRQDPTSEYSAVIPRFITAVLKGDQPTIYGDGGQSRDFTYVANVVEANLRAMNSDVSGVTMNIALGSQVTLLELLERIGRIVGRNADPKFLPARAGDIRHSYATIDRARQLLAFEPVVETEAGLQKTVAWFRDAGDTK